MIGYESLPCFAKDFGKTSFGEKPAEGAFWASLDDEMWMPRSAMDELVEEDGMSLGLEVETQVLAFFSH